MKRIDRQLNKKAAFTIVELLTVMSIIVILIGVLLPALAGVRRYASKVKQMAQFHSIEAAVELFNNEFDGYPPSSAEDSEGDGYCGAMKLCEAMMGQDMLGFHTNSIYRSDGFDAAGTTLYGLAVSDTGYAANLKARKGPFLPSEGADAYPIADIYNNKTELTMMGFKDPCDLVLCDVYTRSMLTGKKTGMPVLYYKANTANSLHYTQEDPTNPLPPSGPTADEGNIYNYRDNHQLVRLGKPWVSAGLTDAQRVHSLNDYNVFYRITRSHKITTASRPYRADSYILLSAGFDGEYGTADDIFNFEWKYKSE